MANAAEANITAQMLLERVSIPKSYTLEVDGQTEDSDHCGWQFGTSKWCR